MKHVATALLERPEVYALWQAPFVRAKLAPFLRHNDSSAERVLDVGCGPGTNARYFQSAEYLGVDINPHYIAYASRRYPGRFRVADAARLQLEPTERFDCVLVNSLLHHLDDDQVRSVLGRLRSYVGEGGFLHVLELVEPRGRGVDAMLARADRGAYSRSEAGWEELVRGFFELVVVEPFVLRFAGVSLWNMIYVKARPR